MKSKTELSLYLKKVILKGYKSIKNVELDLSPGLNIIIGKNAAGKTNFLNFLDKILRLDSKNLFNFYSEVVLQGKHSITMQTFSELDSEDSALLQNYFDPVIESNLLIDGELKEITDNEGSMFKLLEQNNIYYNSIFVCHGLPEDYLIVDKPISFQLKSKSLALDLLKLIRDKTRPSFVSHLILDLILRIGSNNEDEFTIESKIQNTFNELSELKEILKTYTPIEDIRLTDNLNIYLEDNADTSFTIKNLFLEFSINGVWLPFSSLSDGTKRLFYIISEVYDYKTTDSTLAYSSHGILFNATQIGRIISIEEPELGIHPKQFKKLLDFLNAETRNAQIIITTHSPQSLNVLDKSELQKIIIAYHTDDGTQFRHLNDDELQKAQAYIETFFLGDYWVYSDLEN